MRVSTGNYNRLMVQVMQNTMVDLARTSDQLATGKRILQPSDDAVDAVKVLRLNNELNAIGQYENNISSARGWLQQQDVLFGGMNDLLMRSRDILLEAGNGSRSNADLATIADELSSLNEALLSQANHRTANGQYLFSGTTTTQEPFTLVAGDYLYNGNSLHREVEVNGSTTVQLTQPGDALFVDAAAIAPLSDTIFDALAAAVTELSTPTANLDTVVADTIIWIDNTMERIGSAQTRGGSELNLLDQIGGSHGDIKLFAQQLTSSLENVDFVEATTRLNQQQVILSASQQVYANIKNLSLFNYF
ncbi:flagellar hook-associated protein FlgL [Endozoicomonas ascidiicola]|uniref:flagellar hook-associated protein FlgL n=1 Tax=Endozoicomonas ascidiicola TaxID=1698521 RepID=UPI000AD0FF6B|nr:flagellar hook-associated protein FlgL [Endozoicomonas ascidiicola]